MPQNPAVLPVLAQTHLVDHSLLIALVEILKKPLSKLLLTQMSIESGVTQPSKYASQALADPLGDDSFKYPRSSIPFIAHRSQLKDPPFLERLLLFQLGLEVMDLLFEILEDGRDVLMQLLSALFMHLVDLAHDGVQYQKGVLDSAVLVQDSGDFLLQSFNFRFCRV